jgi:hypothetical protein
MLSVWLMVACFGGSDTDDGDSDVCTPDCIDTDDACADRTGGAFVTFQIAGEESFTTWTTNDAFIETAQAHLAAGTTQIPVFDDVIAGTDCADPQWSWHVDPAAVSWADVTIELCDARPSYIEANLDAWIAEVGQWCPWSAVVTAVDDRR